MDACQQEQGRAHRLASLWLLRWHHGQRAASNLQVRNLSSCWLLFWRREGKAWGRTAPIWEALRGCWPYLQVSGWPKPAAEENQAPNQRLNKEALANFSTSGTLPVPSSGRRFPRRAALTPSQPLQLCREPADPTRVRLIFQRVPLLTATPQLGQATQLCKGHLERNCTEDPSYKKQLKIYYFK